VSIHDDRPGGSGGHRADRNHGNAPIEGSERRAGGGEGSGASAYNYYDDESQGYTETAATSMIDPRSEEFYEALGPARKFGWNGGTDLGLLILRLALGADFLSHGARILFGVLGGSGPQRFAQVLASAGYQPSSTLSLVTGGADLASGALLILGLLTPLAAAGVLGVIANVVILELPKGIFAPAGIEFPVALGLIALGLLFTGPGRVALDYGRSWFRHPVVSGFIGLVIGAGAAAGVFYGLHH
jgi:putative oxidoreductase